MEERLCRSVTRDPDGSSLAVPAFSCSTGTEGGGPDVPELGEGGRTPPCPSFGCCTSYLLFRHRSTIPATPRGSWVGILHGTVSALPGGRTGLLCRGSQAVLEQLAPTRHGGGWGKAGTSRPSALSHGVRETQTCVKEELGRGASAPRPPRAFLSLFILLFLHKGKFCGI